ncbi:MAG: tryptophan--tRNA ligase, partial [Pacificibacter sp.]
KIKKAMTDPDGIPETVEGLEGRPEARNLVNIYAALNDMSNEAVVAEYAGAGWGKFKPALADLAVEKLSPISTEMQRYMDDPAEIDRIMAKGAAKAKAISTPILDKTFDIMGFVR